MHLYIFIVPPICVFILQGLVFVIRNLDESIFDDLILNNYSVMNLYLHVPEIRCVLLMPNFCYYLSVSADG